MLEILFAFAVAQYEYEHPSLWVEKFGSQIDTYNLLTCSTCVSILQVQNTEGENLGNENDYLSCATKDKIYSYPSKFNNNTFPLEPCLVNESIDFHFKWFHDDTNTTTDLYLKDAFNNMALYPGRHTVVNHIENVTKELQFPAKTGYIFALPVNQILNVSNYAANWSDYDMIYTRTSLRYVYLGGWSKNLILYPNTSYYVLTSKTISIQMTGLPISTLEGPPLPEVSSFLRVTTEYSLSEHEGFCYFKDMQFIHSDDGCWKNDDLNETIANPSLDPINGYYCFLREKSSTCTADAQGRRLQQQETSNFREKINLWREDPPLAENLFGKIENWDVSAVRDFSSAFEGLADFNRDISAWNTSNGKSMRNMFLGCEKFNLNLSNWDVSKVTDFTNMFSGAKSFWKKESVSVWNFQSAIHVNNMFDAYTKKFFYAKQSNLGKLWIGTIFHPASI